MPHILKAYEIDPERSDTYADLITHYELIGEKEEGQAIARKWKASGDYSPGVMTWNYNMLVSTAPNGLLLTYGDNDTYPAWILQQAEQVRPDVRVINLNLMQIKSYRDLLCKELNMPVLVDPKTSTEVVQHLIKHRGNRPLYTSLTTPYKKWGMDDKLYNVGMALRYSESDVQTLSYLVRNYEQHLLLDHLKCPIQRETYPQATQWCTILYVPSLMMLYKHYWLTNNQQEQQVLKQLITKISNDLPQQAAILEELTNLETTY